ncbi:3-oxoacyl-[acyl-carrier protein] reductase [plant metagenome]|uniref:3-oxoacyl-[acyl-carrier protein] reductase n=1 Tax=plant metagenome TaxID=1297885 RepID=A0A484UNP1_9ZZZZ
MSNAVPNRFAGKVVALTAAASGIGLAALKRFAAEGAMISASDIALEELKKSVAALNIDESRILLSETDASDQGQVERMIADTIAKFDRLDVLVNNAGLGSWGFVHEVEVERWHKVIGITLNSVFYACRAAMPHLIKTQGAIVNTASISGLFGDNGFSAYNAAKGGVVNLTRCLAIDHAKQNVRVNAICPGLTDTPRVSWMRQTSAIMDDYDRRLPMGRAGTADEMAAAISFLASSDASYITGVNLAIDGGLTAATGQPMFLELLPERK